MKRVILYCATLIATSLATLACSTEVDSRQTVFTQGEQIDAVEALIERVVKEHHKSFRVKFLPARQDQKDFYQLSSDGRHIVLAGNNGISIASALNHYLKEYCGAHISWNGCNMDLPAELPLPSQEVERVSPYKYRYYLNYCTFNYTMSWWDWERWQWEIDFMALNGVNMPLALTGQNSVWQRVYNKLGFSNEELESFFSGPAYFNWFWMGNLDGWNGPLPQSFMDKHEALQKKILRQERSLGMTPILPAFTGHVPPAFAEKFPEVKVRKTSWVNFPEVAVLDPSEDMFMTIGKLFIEEQEALYGTNHYYSADTFNENEPPTKDSTYLSDISQRVYQSMAEADPEATWIMQGWLFYHDREFWGDEQIQALLSSVDDDKMIILDLWSERFPVWSRTNAYYGKPWIWCMLQNFGQNITMSGNVKSITQDPAQCLADPAAKNMRGIGLTMEGIEHNPIVYAMMLENVWRDTAIDVDEFIEGYTTQRYGKESAEAQRCWQIISRTVLEDQKTNGGPESIISSRPTFKQNPRGTTNTELPYSNDSLIMAWDLILRCADDLSSSDGFRYDIVDITRQVLANYATYLQQQCAEAFERGNIEEYKAASKEFLTLISDMDTLLATRREFLLGRWLESAKAMGTTPEESALYERNARNLLGLWGDKECYIADYTCRQWSGMLSGYYYKRWEQFFAQTTQALIEGKEFDHKSFEQEIKEWEWEWIGAQELYPTEASGNAIEQAKALYTKYRKDAPKRSLMQ